MIEKHACYQVGLIVKTHGIAGEVVVRLFDEFSVDSLDTEFIFLDLDGGLVPFCVDSYREKNKSDVLVKFEQLPDDSSALKVVDAPVYIEKGEVVDDGEETEQKSSAYQLIGYKCQAVGIGPIGEVVAIKEISKNPLFELDNDGTEILIPIVEDFIAGIDDEKQIIVFDLPEGLIDLD